MPLTHLISPDDGGLTLVEHARGGSLDPWYPRAYILEILDGERYYDGGVPSVTQLQNGPRYEILKATTDYSVDPDRCAWQIIGNAGHYLMQSYGDKWADEIRWVTDYMTGRPDVVIDGKTAGIEDYKVWGSFRVARTLGIRWVSRPQFNPDGSPQVYGKKAQKAGQQKYRRELVKTEPDTFDLRAQLNGYRILIEQGEPRWDGAGPEPEGWQEKIARPERVDWLRAFLIAREGGTAKARDYELRQNTYRIDIEVVRNGTVEDWFEKRSDELRTTFAKGEVGRLCDRRESWDGKRCAQYCEVAKTCRAIGDNEWLGRLNGNEDKSREEGSIQTEILQR